MAICRQHFNPLGKKDPVRVSPIIRAVAWQLWLIGPCRIWIQIFYCDAERITIEKDRVVDNINNIQIPYSYRWDDCMGDGSRGSIMATFSIPNEAAQDTIQICPWYIRKWQSRSDQTIGDLEDEGLGGVGDLSVKFDELGRMDSALLHEVRGPVCS